MDMKETGISRSIDELGRIVVPRDIRRQLGIVEGDAFDVCVGPDGVYFRKMDENRNIKHAVDALAEAVNDKNYDDPSCYARLAPIVRELQQAMREIRDEKGGSV